VFRGVMPFIAMDVLRVLLLIAMPSIALLIPSTM
jgi:C4-dicarboxylate transporter, DctM subunit